MPGSSRSRNMKTSVPKSSRGYDRETFHQGIRMKPHRIATALLLLAVSAPALADIDRLQALSQQEFRLLAEALGAALSYKPLQPTAPLNLGGFDIGVAVTGTQLKHSDLFERATGESDFRSEERRVGT